MKILTFLLLLIPFLVQAQDKKKIESDKNSSIMKYSMKHPLHQWDATTKSTKAVIVYNSKTQKIEAIAVVIPIKSFDSGNSNRDSHAIEVLEALKFPNVSFTANNIVEKDDKIIAKGNLTFHGISQSIEIIGVKKIVNNKLTLAGGFEIKMTDFKVEQPTLMGIKTEDNIKLSFDLGFKM